MTPRTMQTLQGQSNGIGTLPTMIKPLIKRWAINEPIAYVEHQINEPIDEMY